MTPSQPNQQQILLIEKDNVQYEVLVGVMPTDDIVIIGVRDAVTKQKVESSVITESDICNAVEMLEWAFDNDPDIVDGPKPVTRLFLEQADRHYEIVVGQTKERKLVPLGIRNAINHNELCDDEMPDMSRFVEAVRLWQWAESEDGRNLNINYGGDTG